MARLRDVAKVIIFLVGGFAIIVVGGFMMRSIAKLWDNKENKKNSDKTMTALATAFLFVLVLSSFNDVHAAIGEYSVSLVGETWEAHVGKQIQITSDLTNNQDRTQPFAYLVQIQNEDGVTVSLSWISGVLEPGQSMSPSQSWTPTVVGEYNAQIFVWESVDNPDALSVPLTMKIKVAETENT
jgi:hypothetical protein